MNSELDSENLFFGDFMVFFNLFYFILPANIGSSKKEGRLLLGLGEVPKAHSGTRSLRGSQIFLLLVRFVRISQELQFVDNGHLLFL